MAACCVCSLELDTSSGLLQFLLCGFVIDINIFKMSSPALGSVGLWLAYRPWNQRASGSIPGQGLVSRLWMLSVSKTLYLWGVMLLALSNIDEK